MTKIKVRSAYRIRWNAFIAYTIIFLLLPVVVFTLKRINTFLSISAPVDADVLIVEGWLYNYMYDEIVIEITTKHYLKVLTVGTDIARPFQCNETGKICSTYAELASERLIAHGIDATNIITINAQKVHSRKTYSMAKDCRLWLERNIPTVTALNVYSGGPHGRKTAVAFKKAFEPSIKIGVFSAKIKHYSSEYWFLSLRGIMATMKNLIGYLYELCQLPNIHKEHR